MNTILYWKRRALKAESELMRSRTDHTFGIYSRYGIERIVQQWRRQPMFLIFGDLDHIHELNEEHGYEAVDRSVRTAFQEIKERLEPGMLLARWYSGDEWILVFRRDPAKYLDLIISTFKDEGISLTLAMSHTREFNGKLGDLVYPAAKKVARAKKYNNRGGYVGAVKRRF